MWDMWAGRSKVAVGLLCAMAVISGTVTTAASRAEAAPTGKNQTDCSTNPRLTYKTPFAMDVCWTPYTLTLTNTFSNYVVDVSASGDPDINVGPATPTPAATVASHVFEQNYGNGGSGESVIVPPGYQVTILLGSGAGLISVEEAAFATYEYTALGYLSGKLPVDVLGDFSAVQAYAQAFSTNTAAYNTCVAGAKGGVQARLCEVQWNLSMTIPSAQLQLAIVSQFGDALGKVVSKALAVLNIAVLDVQSATDLRRFDRDGTQIMVAPLGVPIRSTTTSVTLSGTVGTPIASQSVSFSGGTGTASVDLSGTPAWLSATVSGNSVSFSGTPTSTTPISGSLTLFDGAGDSLQLPVTGTIAPDPDAESVFTTSLPGLILNKPYATQLSASGTGPWTWTLVSGQLPTGVTLNPDGSLTGTPSDTGGSFTVQVQDSTRATATGTFSINPTTLANPVQQSIQVTTVGDTVTWTLHVTDPNSVGLGAFGINAVCFDPTTGYRTSGIGTGPEYAYQALTSGTLNDGVYAWTVNMATASQNTAYGNCYTWNTNFGDLDGGSAIYGSQDPAQWASYPFDASFVLPGSSAAGA